MHLSYGMGVSVGEELSKEREDLSVQRARLVWMPEA